MDESEADAAVLFVHGTSRGSLVRLWNYLVEHSVASLGSRVDYKSVNYAAALEGAERSTLAGAALPLLRSLPFSDCVVAMRYFSDRAYRLQCHVCVARGLSELAAATNAATVVIMAHSLGTVVTTDVLRSLADGSAPREVRAALTDAGAALLGRLQCLYTLGCPVGWFAGFGAAAPPPERRSDAGSRVSLGDFAWVNMLYQSDVLVGPISTLSPAFAHVVDVVVPPGLDPLKRTPLSHAYYMWDKYVYAYIAADLVALRTGAAAVRGGVLRPRSGDAVPELADRRNASVNCLLQLGGSAVTLEELEASQVVGEGAPPGDDDDPFALPPSATAADSTTDRAVSHTLRVGEGAPVAAVLYLHGMCAEEAAEAECELARRRVARIAKRLGVAVLLQTVNYASIARPLSQHAWDATVQPFALTWLLLRGVVQHRCHVAMLFMTQGWFRAAVTQALDRSLQRLGAATRGRPVPLVCVGYSFGAIVATTYLGSMQRFPPGAGAGDARRAAREQVAQLQSLLTVGSPLPWFLDGGSMRLPSCADWTNVFYGVDAAASANKPLSSQLAKAVRRDVQLPAGVNVPGAVLGGLSAKYLRDDAIWNLVGEAVGAAAGKRFAPFRRGRKRWTVLAAAVLWVMWWRLRRR